MAEEEAGVATEGGDVPIVDVAPVDVKVERSTPQPKVSSSGSIQKTPTPPAGPPPAASSMASKLNSLKERRTTATPPQAKVCSDHGMHSTCLHGLGMHALDALPCTCKCDAQLPMPTRMKYPILPPCLHSLAQDTHDTVPTNTIPLCTVRPQPPTTTAAPVAADASALGAAAAEVAAKRDAAASKLPSPGPGALTGITTPPVTNSKLPSASPQRGRKLSPGRVRASPRNMSARSHSSGQVEGSPGRGLSPGRADGGWNIYNREVPRNKPQVRF